MPKKKNGGANPPEASVPSHLREILRFYDASGPGGPPAVENPRSQGLRQIWAGPKGEIISVRLLIETFMPLTFHRPRVRGFPPSRCFGPKWCHLCKEDVRDPLLPGFLVGVVDTKTAAVRVLLVEQDRRPTSLFSALEQNLKSDGHPELILSIRNDNFKYSVEVTSSNALLATERVAVAAFNEKRNKNPKILLDSFKYNSAKEVAKAYEQALKEKQSREG